MLYRVGSNVWRRFVFIPIKMAPGTCMVKVVTGKTYHGRKAAYRDKMKATWYPKENEVVVVKPRSEFPPFSTVWEPFDEVE